MTRLLGSAFIFVILCILAAPAFAANANFRLQETANPSCEQGVQLPEFEYLRHLKDDPAAAPKLDSVGAAIQRELDKDATGLRRTFLEFLRAQWTTQNFMRARMEHPRYLKLYRAQIETGELAPVSVRKVSDQVGLGVFADAPITKGQMIGEYTGIVRKRRGGDRSNHYLFNIPISDFVIDAEREGNETRFINHSEMHANCENFPVFHQNRWHIVIIAKRDIGAGEQLLFDYGRAYWIGREAPTELEPSRDRP